MSLTADAFDGWAVISESPDPATNSGDVVATFSICDDCQSAYMDPPYYVFETSACNTTMPGAVIPIPHAECTGNLCPDCAIDLEPDDENDPRRQEWVDNGAGEWTSTGIKP